MEVPITKLHDNAILPSYQTKHSAAVDLTACLEEPVRLERLDRAVIPTGLAIALPEGFEAQIRARSGLSLKHGLCLANGIGTIDADYRGEIGVIVINLGKEAFVVEPGMRIAQLVLARYEPIVWQEVDELATTERGTGGYGSTGH